MQNIEDSNGSGDLDGSGNGCGDGDGRSDDNGDGGSSSYGGDGFGEETGDGDGYGYGDGYGVSNGCGDGVSGPHIGSYCGNGDCQYMWFDLCDLVPDNVVTFSPDPYVAELYLGYINAESNEERESAVAILELFMETHDE